MAAVDKVEGGSGKEQDGIALLASSWVVEVDTCSIVAVPFRNHLFDFVRHCLVPTDI